MVEPRRPFNGSDAGPTVRRGYGSRPRQQFPGRRDNLNAPEAPIPDIAHTEHQQKHEKHERNESFLEAFIKLINSILRLKGK